MLGGRESEVDLAAGTTAAATLSASGLGAGTTAEAADSGDSLASLAALSAAIMTGLTMVEILLSCVVLGGLADD